MKKSWICMLLLSAATVVFAVPARPGWVTVQAEDGTQVEVQMVGDEWYRYVVSRDGREMRLNANGVYETIGKAPTAEQVRARRAAAPQRAPMASAAEYGYTPYLPPRGVVIMANFQDVKFNENTTVAKIDELCNSEHCTLNRYNNVDYGSIAQYFRDQSDGQYNLQFDIYGPVTLAHNYAHYGENYGGSDHYAADAVIEACQLANDQIDFSQYDWNSDGKVDFVYIIYAGYGENETYKTNTNTIWPHSWDISSARYYQMCSYPEAQWQFDGKTVLKYAVSNELEYSTDELAGIGIICHEYSHVMGVPDMYPTVDPHENTTKLLTPNYWDVMDCGCYNGGSRCPPSYNVWEKAFCGWYTPQNLGNEGQRLSLTANGKEGYNAYQINATGTQQAVNSTGECYYIENRQKQGWDTYVPGHGMLIWKVKYNRNAWNNNKVNNTANDPYMTIVSAYGTEIGKGSNAKNNPFPGSQKVTSWEGLTGKPLMGITEKDSVVSLVYIDAPYTVTWMADGEVIETKQYKWDGSEALVAPTSEVTPCEGTTFIGWTMHSVWADPFVAPEDLFTVPAGNVADDLTFYAVFE